MKTFSSKAKNHLPTPKRPSLRQAAHCPDCAQQPRVIRQLLRRPRLQAKLTVGAPHDAYEQEADRVADAVMRMPEEGLARQPLEEEEELVQTKPIDQEACCPELQRQVEEEEEEEFLQAKGDGGGAAGVGPDLEQAIASRRGDGRPLPEESRSFFEPRMGLDLSHVQVHTGAPAADLSQRVNARAFTLGADIYFGAGQFSPGSFEGKKLLAHELTHVAQQGALNGTGLRIQRQSPGSGIPTGFRLASNAYDKEGNPLPTALTPDEITQLQAAITGVLARNPDLHTQIANENILLSRATLFEQTEDSAVEEGIGKPQIPHSTVDPISKFTEFGKLFASFKKQTLEKYEAEWWTFDQAGGDCLAGIHPTEAALDTASQMLEANVTKAVLTKMNETLVTRHCRDITSESVVVLDLNQIAKQKEDPLSVLQHELGHYIHLKDVKFVDEKVSAFPTFPALSPDMTEALNALGYDKIVTDEAKLLNEFAARYLEEQQQFDENKFIEEFDLKFGVEGYRTIDGNRSAPTGFGIRVAEDLTLLDAKNQYRSLKADPAGVTPIFLKTEVFLEKWLRRFEVVIGQYTDRKTAKTAASALKQSHPHLDNKVAPY